MQLVGYDVIVSGVTPKTGRAPTNSQLSPVSVEMAILRIRAASRDRDTDLCSSTGSIPSMGGVRKEGWKEKRQS